MPRRPGALLATLLLGAGVALAGCNSSTTQSVADAARAGDNKGFVAGDGTVEQLPASRRQQPLALSGTTVTGARWSMAADGAGKVVVVNVWGVWCPPCIEELPHLQSAWASYEKAGAPVAFIGVDTRDQPVTAAAFLASRKVTYPSISDQGSGGQPLLALQGRATTTPTTLVLDRQGRIAARVLGGTTESTLTALIDDVLAEKA
ncbi:TlpA disulfide reductase family protein [Dermatophilaceae bacterium Soc4.6]